MIKIENTPTEWQRCTATKEQMKHGSVKKKYPVAMPEFGMIVFIKDPATEEQIRKKYTDHFNSYHTRRW